MLGTNVVIYYLPFLLLSGTIAGVVVGIASGVLIKKVDLGIGNTKKSRPGDIVSPEDKAERSSDEG
jgi:uncharacterized membrane protein